MQFKLPHLQPIPVPPLDVVHGNIKFIPQNTNNIFRGDTILLLQSNHGNPSINPMSTPSFVSEVEEVNRRSILMKNSIDDPTHPFDYK